MLVAIFVLWAVTLLLTSSEHGIGTCESRCHGTRSDCRRRCIEHFTPVAADPRLKVEASEHLFALANGAHERLEQERSTIDLVLFAAKKSSATDEEWMTWVRWLAAGTQST